MKIFYVLPLFALLTKFTLICGLKRSSTSNISEQMIEAAYTGQTEFLKTLINQGADVNYSDEYGYSSLIAASRNGQLAVVQILLDKGVNKEKQDKKGETALHAASWANHQDVLLALVKAGAKIDSIDNDGWTPLHTAVYNGHVEAVKLLLDNGADPTVKDNVGETPLDISLRKEFTQDKFTKSKFTEITSLLNLAVSQVASKLKAPDMIIDDLRKQISKQQQLTDDFRKQNEKLVVDYTQRWQKLKSDFKVQIEQTAYLQKQVAQLQTRLGNCDCQKESEMI